MFDLIYFQAPRRVENMVHCAVLLMDFWCLKIWSITVFDLLNPSQNLGEETKK